MTSPELKRSKLRHLEVRHLTSDLLPAVLELDQQCFGGLWTRDGYQREIDSPNSDLLVMLATGERFGTSINRPLVVGLACLWSIVDEAHITIIAVHPIYQHQGLGQALLLALLRTAYQRRLERSTLEVRISNQSAVNLYQKFGFKEAGRRKGYYEDTGEDALILWRGGLQAPDFPELLAKWAEEVSDRLDRHNWSNMVAFDTVVSKKVFLDLSSRFR